MSKGWFNWAVMNQAKEIIREGKTDNTIAAIAALIVRLKTLLDLPDLSEIEMVMEHTGIYCNHLAVVWSQHGGKFSMIPASDISRALAGLNGWDHKTDELDAQRIAEYGVRFHDKLPGTELKTAKIKKLKKLRAQRNRLVKVCAMLSVPLREEADFESKELVLLLESHQADAIESLQAAIDSVERDIEHTVSASAQLDRYYKLIQSVEGVGPVTALEVIICTEGFTIFDTSQSSAFKRYVAVAPMPNQSGKRKGKLRTRNRGVKKLKSLFTMGAISLIRSSGEITDYYHRKIKEGKHHMCVVNAMRAKLIDRIFAVVRNDTMYKKKLNLN